MWYASHTGDEVKNLSVDRQKPNRLLSRFPFYAYLGKFLGFEQVFLVWCAQLPIWPHQPPMGGFVRGPFYGKQRSKTQHNYAFPLCIYFFSHFSQSALCTCIKCNWQRSLRVSVYFGLRFRRQGLFYTIHHVGQLAPRDAAASVSITSHILKITMKQTVSRPYSFFAFPSDSLNIYTCNFPLIYWNNVSKLYADNLARGFTVDRSWNPHVLFRITSVFSAVLYYLR